MFVSQFFLSLFFVFVRFSLLRVKATLGGLAELEEDLLKKRNKRADKQAFVRDQMAEARKILEARGKRCGDVVGMHGNIRLVVKEKVD